MPVRRGLVVGVVGIAALLAAAVALLANGQTLDETHPTEEAAQTPTSEAQARLPEGQPGPVHEGLLAQYLVDTQVHPEALTRDEDQLVRWALWRFSAAELDLSDVQIRFQDDTLSCGGREGLYHPETATVYVCVARKRTILHELAHAWTDAQLTEAHRDAFVSLRRLGDWDRREDPWHLRGTEHASEIITWALMDEPIHVPTTPDGPDGAIVFRLLSIPDSDVDALAFGYQFLTGTSAPFRHASEWEGILEIGNPELRHVR